MKKFAFALLAVLGIALVADAAPRRVAVRQPIRRAAIRAPRVQVRVGRVASVRVGRVAPVRVQRVVVAPVRVQRVVVNQGYNYNQAQQIVVRRNYSYNQAQQIVVQRFVAAPPADYTPTQPEQTQVQPVVQRVVVQQDTAGYCAPVSQVLQPQQVRLRDTAQPYGCGGASQFRSGY